MKTVVMELWHSGDALNGADYAALEVTQEMALELLVLIARSHKMLAEEEKFCAIIYRDLYIPTFLRELEEGGYGDRLDSLLLEAAQSGTWDSGILVFDGKIEIPNEAERFLEYPKLWVQRDRVFWRGSYRHEDTIVETAPLMFELLEQITREKPCR